MKFQNFKKACILTLTLVFYLYICACGDAEDPTDSSLHFDYTVDDVVKENLMWDTTELFSKKPVTIEQKNIFVGENYTAFKFKSVAYSQKGLTETEPFAVIGVPKTTMPAGGFPAIVLVHGGNGYVFRDWIKYWNTLGYVAVALDIFGNQLDENIGKGINPGGGPDESKAGSLIDDPDDHLNSWLYHSVTNVILCNNILRARTDVNIDKIGITGISWGGVVTNVVSGVDKRFAAFAPVYGSGYLYDDSFWSGGVFGSSDADSDKRKAWIEKFDPSSYLPYSVKPMLFVSGINDNCFSVVNRAKSAGLIKGKAFYSQRQALGHGYFWEETPEIYEFMQHILFDEDCVNVIEASGEKDGIAFIRFYDSARITNLKLVYTVSISADSHDWQWQNRKMEISADGLCELALPEDVTAYIFEFTVLSGRKIEAFFNYPIQYKISSEIYIKLV